MKINKVVIKLFLSVLSTKSRRDFKSQNSRNHTVKSLRIEECREKQQDHTPKIVPSQRVAIRDCDEPPAEFCRVGIGLCFKGKKKLSEHLHLHLHLWTGERSVPFLLLSYTTPCMNKSQIPKPSR